MVHRPDIPETRAGQRAVLDDPLVWQHEAWDALFGSGPFDRLLPNVPPAMEAHRIEAFRPAELAARTPGADAQRAIDRLSDRTMDYATEAGSFGMEFGAVLEQRRQGVLAVLRRSERPPVWDDEMRDEHARARADLEELAETGAGERLVALRARLAGDGCLDAPEDDGADDGADPAAA